MERQAEPSKRVRARHRVGLVLRRHVESEARLAVYSMVLVWYRWRGHVRSSLRPSIARRRSAGSECLLFFICEEGDAILASSFSRHLTQLPHGGLHRFGQNSQKASFSSEFTAEGSTGPQRGARVNFGHSPCAASISEVKSSCILRANKTPLMESCGCRQAAEEARARPANAIADVSASPDFTRRLGRGEVCARAGRQDLLARAPVVFALLLARSWLRQMREQRLSIAKVEKGKGEEWHSTLVSSRPSHSLSYSEIRWQRWNFCSAVRAVRDVSYRDRGSA